MRAVPSLAVALIFAVSGLAACGDGDDGGDEAVDAAAPRSTAQDLDRFLLREGDEPGSRPGAAPGATPRSRATITGVEAFVKEMRLTPADERRLRSEGFVSFTVQPIRGAGRAGVSNVALYETAQGAKDSLAHEVRPDVIRAFGPLENLRFFTVPGVPGRAGGPRPSPRSATSNGCRVGACSSSATRDPAA